MVTCGGEKIYECLVKPLVMNYSPFFRSKSPGFDSQYVLNKSSSELFGGSLLTQSTRQYLLYSDWEDQQSVKLLLIPVMPSLSTTSCIHSEK